MSTPWIVAVKDAACVGMESLFHGPDDYDEPVDQRQWRQRHAIQICDDCPVRTPCLINELTYSVNAQHGVRGGMTAPARRRLLTQWRKQGHLSQTIPAGDPELVAALLTAVIA